MFCIYLYILYVNIVFTMVRSSMCPQLIKQKCIKYLRDFHFKESNRQ